MVLPLWPDNYRAAPNRALRCSLFTVQSLNAPRRLCNDILLTTMGTEEIRYSGEELTQLDADVFLELVHCGRKAPLGQVFEVSPRELLRSLGWSMQENRYLALFASVHRMSWAQVTWYQDRRFVTQIDGTQAAELLEPEGDKDARLGFEAHNILTEFKGKLPQPGQRFADVPWFVAIHPVFGELFADKQYARICWALRKSVRSSCAKFLLNFFSTHRKPPPLLITELQRVTGSAVGRSDNWRHLLTKACEELVKVGFLSSFAFHGRSEETTLFVKCIPLIDQVARYSRTAVARPVE